MGNYDNAAGLAAIALKKHAASSPALRHLLVELEPEWELFAMALRDEGLLVEGARRNPLGTAADLLAALVPVPVSFEYPGFIFVMLAPNRQVSIGDTGDVDENLGFQLDDDEGRNLEAFTIEANMASHPDEIAAAAAKALQPYLPDNCISAWFRDEPPGDNSTGE